MPRPARLPRPSLVEEARLLPLLARSPALAFARVHQRHGPIVRLGRGPFATVCAFGREANELLLSERTDAFLWRDALAPLIPVDGDTALVVSDGDDHRRRRRLVQPAFGIRRVEAHLPTIVDETRRVIDGWPADEEADVAGDLRTAVRRIVVRALFGDRLRDRADEIGATLEEAIDYVNRSPVTRFDHDWPGTPYRRAMRARARVDEIVYAEIAARRADPPGTADVLTALLAAQDDEGGQPLTDQEVRDQVVSLIAAGYDTTSAGVAWAAHAVFSRPAVRDRLRAEVAEVVGDGDPTPGTLAEMAYLDGVVSEVLRLWPPGAFSARKAIEDVPFAGHVIPAGALVVYSQWVTHRLPALWSDPERFDPERWVAGSPTYAEPAPYAYVPFGGGYRRCIGFALATMEIKAILAELVRRVDLDGLGPEPVPVGVATTSPRGGIRATVRPRA